MTSSVDTNDRDSYYFRRAVRAVLSDRNGQIALMYAKQRDYYKLPGGGVDEGDDEKNQDKRLFQKACCAQPS